MRRITLILILTLTAVATPALAGTVAAQEANQTTTATPSSTPEVDRTIELSKTTSITNWRFENGTFYITFKSELPTRIAITDAGKLSRILSEGEGEAAGKARMRRLTLTPGTTTVKFNAEDFNGASAVTISSSNADGIVALRSDAVRAGNPPVKWGTANALVGGAAIVTAAGTFLYVKKKREDKEMTAERLL
ncbi:hypothetical protein KU306_02515 [Haloferax larsenii]|uniref:PGF-CTERM protein n=1 Tax=Haloferax larsenii TaxID=302484 RepID=A0ABY5REK4_HALLR|nr:hypothetical protein [Haloferax larsenii]UVE50782.1 hypothetical protein KU306_02515 [Haloferax larsenii]